MNQIQLFMSPGTWGTVPKGSYRWSEYDAKVEGNQFQEWKRGYGERQRRFYIRVDKASAETDTENLNSICSRNHNGES